MKKASPSGAYHPSPGYLQESDTLDGSPEQQAELEARLISDMNLDDATLIGMSDSLGQK